MNAFNKGWDNLRRKDIPKVREILKKELGLTQNSSLSYRRNGYCNHNPTERKAIESAFKKFGIPKEMVWGE